MPKAKARVWAFLFRTERNTEDTVVAIVTAPNKETAYTKGIGYTDDLYDGNLTEAGAYGGGGWDDSAEFLVEEITTAAALVRLSKRAENMEIAPKIRNEAWKQNLAYLRTLLPK